VGEDQLNGGQFGAFTSAHWELLRPVLEENERVFGIPVDRLLGASGAALQPDRVYRMVIPSRVRALQAEQAWVAQH
jgi:hypothetical protein